jgi:hypothetical protein
MQMRAALPSACAREGRINISAWLGDLVFLLDGPVMDPQRSNNMPQNSPAKTAPKYPLLEELLSVQGETLKALYSNRDVAKLFGVSVRAIQDWVAKGLLDARDLPGRARFLSQDLEEFLANSTRKKPE